MKKIGSKKNDKERESGGVERDIDEEWRGISRRSGEGYCTIPLIFQLQSSPSSSSSTSSPSSSSSSSS